MIPSIELQKSIYGELSKGNYPIYEVRPLGVEGMPFITISDFNKETNFTKTDKDRFTFSVMLHGWSHANGSTEIKQIENFIYEKITSLEMTTYEVEFVQLSLNTNIKEEESADRVIFHSIQEFEITIKPIKGE